MSVKVLIERINDIYPTLEGVAGHSIMALINDFQREKDEEYKKNRTNRALTFGKWKGFTVKELAVSEKGKDYLQWLLSQSWFTEDKYTDLYGDLKVANIKKKISKRADLK